MKSAGIERDITHSRQTARPHDSAEAKSFFTSARRSVRRGLLGAAMLLGAAATAIAQTIAVPDGYATQNGGTTGGGNATPITVSTASAFQSAISGNNPAVIIVNGRLNVGDVNVGSNKTIVGANNSSGLYGGVIGIRGTNYILQNLTIGPAPIDALEISGARNVFITKCEFYGSTDELCSIVRQADFVTVSWSKFHFPNSDSHSFAHLIGNGDDVTADRGKLHVTMHHNWYAPGVEGRMPRVRFGHVHLYNNYYNAVGNGYCIGVGFECNIRLENSVFESVSAPWADYGGTSNGKLGWAGLQFINATQPTFMPNTFPVFTPPYAFTLDPVGNVKSIVTAGAGNRPLNPTTPTVPATPGGLNASAGNAQVSLTWSASSGATSYNVKRATTSGGAYTTVGSPTGTSYTNTGLTNGTTYYYVVSAVNSAGQSGNSSQVSATPSASIVPALQIEASVLGGGVTIDSDNAGFNGTGFANFPVTGGSAQFNNVNGGTGGAATVLVRYALGATASRTGALLVNGVSQPITFAPTGGWPSWATVSVSITLNSGTANTLRFESNGADLGNIDEITVTPSTVTTPPVAPGGLNATAGNAQVSLSWSASSGATSYNVKRSTTSGGPFTTLSSSSGTSYVNTGLTNGTTYYYVVSAVNSSGESANSSQTSATPQGSTTPPTTVTFTSVGAEDGYVTESTETSGIGGTASASDASNSALRTGDTGSGQQYKLVVSFNTASLPDGAVITGAVLKIKRGKLTGTNPFTVLGTCNVDIKGGTGFGGATTLVAADFEAAADATAVATMSNAANNGDVSSGSINATGRGLINKTGTTQLRVSFATDDNNNAASDHIGWYGGDDATAANRPVLEITYQ